MKKIVLGLFSLACLGTLWAKTDTVWTSAGDGAKAPAYWYTYTFGNGSSVDTSNVDGYRVADFTASTSGSNGAGYGFAWEQNASYKDVPVSLSGYKGACLTYKATAPVRMDFKQSTIKDDNYYGTLLDSASAFKTVFVAFDDLNQDWKSSSTVKWNAASQLGVQFSYKNTVAKTYGKTNTFTLAAFIMGDSCMTYPPELLESYKSANADGKIASTVLKESDTLALDLSKIFYDKDGDALKISVNLKNLVSGSLTLLNAKTGYGLDDVLRFVPKANLNGTALVTLVAKDSKDSAVYRLVVNTLDEENPPVAVNDSYSVNEDDTLKVAVKNSILLNDYDVDGTPFSIVSHTTASHGTLDVDTLLGTFTYIPAPNYCGTDQWNYTLADTTGLQGRPGTVYISVKCVNDPPVVVADTAAYDTLVRKEDFNAPIRFNAASVKSWFEDPDGDKLYIGATSDDGKLDVTVSTAGDIVVKSVKDSCGDAFITVFATDSISGSASFKIHVFLTPVNDRPVAKWDTIVEMKTSGFEVVVDLDTVFFDPDGDSLGYEVLSAKGNLKAEISGSILTIVPGDSLELAEGPYPVRIRAKDGDGLCADGAVVLLIGGTTKIAPRFARGFMSWKEAIRSARGTVKLFGMDGRMLWQGNLPASESEIRDAAFRASEKTILRVNRKSWVISPESL